ncbi:hypothetical protein [Streptomyces sp. OR43]|uniref:hypothetical protein n=1 Tax=Streptomyces sp. or43 TaxID=2478957 RepID=UPI0011CDAE13|nr:hypothetical protein [Streptomyces sp. or43]
MGINMRKNESALISGAVAVSVLTVTLAGCGSDDASSDAAPRVKPSATASPTADLSKPVSPWPDISAVQKPEKTARREPKKVTLSLAEIVDNPGTFERFKEFVAKHGSDEQRKAVRHLKGWRGYERKAYPVLEASSDYATVNYEAIDGGDEAESDKMMGLEAQSQHMAEAFDAWWEVDEVSVLQVYDRSGENAVGTACIRPDSVESEGSCI